MTTELEQVLTEVLTASAARITPERLRYQGLRGTAGQRRRVSRRTVLVAVAAVLAVVAGVGVAARGLFGDRFEVTAAAQAYIGTQWRLESVEHDGRTTTVPASVRATLALGRDGRYGIDDSVNYISGRYSVTPEGFVADDMGTTLVGYDGSDPRRTTAIEALGSIVMGRASTDGTFGAARAVTAEVLDGRLVLRTWGYRLTFHRDTSTRQP